MKTALPHLALGVLCLMPVLLAPGWEENTDAGHQRDTIAQLRSIAVTIEEYSIDQNIYPRVTSIDELRPLVEPRYIPELPERDAWDSPFFIDSTLHTYTIGSCGKNATSCTTLTLVGKGGPTDKVGDDIIFSNGKFIQWPRAIPADPR